jgi:formamidopyrimidine-DNA glycosylase
MPELPEVETIKRGLEVLKNKKILHIFRSQKKFRIESSLDLQGLVGAKILQFERRARYLLINFSNKKTLILHLGMSGKVTVAKKFQQLKHDHFKIEFDGGLYLIFNDPRRFGFLDLVVTKNLKNHKILTKLGVEPLSDEFNFSALRKKLRSKKMNIKTAMMDNKIVVGVGNIYINESLFNSGISPLREASSLKENEIKKLVSSIKKILKKAIDLGGSSISDYVTASGNLGNFQNNFCVYGRANKKCPHCQNLIKKIMQNGRSSFYCSICQK